MLAHRIGGSLRVAGGDGLHNPCVSALLSGAKCFDQIPRAVVE